MKYYILYLYIFYIYIYIMCLILLLWPFSTNPVLQLNNYFFVAHHENVSKNHTVCSYLAKGWAEILEIPTSLKI